MHLFAYGTLMFPDVWRRVVGRAFAAQRAILGGFSVRCVDLGAFPVMIRSDSIEERVEGLVYFNIDDATRKRLDEYESALYERIDVYPVLDSGNAIACQAYVLSDGKRRHALTEHWDAAQFQRDELADYLRGLDDPQSESIDCGRS
jgi:gamma-glutamylcyclotransferase (GGCT)/AIG2-like uncharacterized protein YtfP